MEFDLIVLTTLLIFIESFLSLYALDITCRIVLIHSNISFSLKKIIIIFFLLHCMEMKRNIHIKDEPKKSFYSKKLNHLKKLNGNFKFISNFNISKSK